MAKLNDPSAGERPTPRLGEAPGHLQVRGPGEGVARGFELLSQDLGRAGEELYRATKVEEGRINDLRAEEAFTKLRERQLYLSIDQTQGFTQVKGSDAVSRPLLSEYGKRFQDAETEIATGLSNDEQRQAFKKRADVSRLQFNEEILRHLAREGDVYAKQVYEGTMAVEQKNAIERWDSPNDVELSLSRIRSAVQERAERYGWAKDFREGQERIEAGKVHAAVIQQAIAGGNYKYGEDWFNAHKGELDLATSKAIEKAVEDGTQKELANGYRAEFLAGQEDPKALEDLRTRVLGDKTLDDARRNALLGPIQNREMQLAARAEVQRARALKKVERGIDELNSNTLAGFEPTIEQFAPYIAATKGTELEPQVQAAIGLANATRTFRNQPPAVQERLLAEAEAGVRDQPTKFDRKVVGAWRSIYDAQQRQVKDNPITFAVQQGLVPPPAPLDLANPQTTGAALAERFSISREMAAKYNAPLKPLTEQEVNLMRAALKGAPAQEKRQWFSGLAQAAGNDYQGFSAVMSQLAPDDPVTAVAGTYAYRGRTQASDLMLRGQAILNPVRKEDGKPDGGKLWPMPPEAELRKGFQSYEKDAFAGHPAARSAMYQSATAIYAAKSADEGDASGVINSNRWEESIKLATGGIEKYRGKAIVLPYGFTYSQFRDNLGKRIETLMDSGQLAPEVTREKLQDLPLEAIGDGRYVFKAGDGILFTAPKASKATIKNQDGTVSTERTITIETDGRHVVLPTIVNGKQLPSAEAIKMWRAGTNQAVGEFDNAQAANRFAEQRTARLTEELRPRPVIIDFNIGLPFRTSGYGQEPASNPMQPSPAELAGAAKAATGRTASLKKPAASQQALKP